MAAERYSILLVGNPSDDTTRIRESLIARDLRCSTASPEAACDLLRTDHPPRHDVVLIDEASSNGHLAAILSALKERRETTPDVIILATDSTAPVPPDANETVRLAKSRYDADAVLRLVESQADRHRLSTALAQSESQYASLLQSVTDYTYTVRIEDGKPHSSRHSPGCVAVTGYTPEEYEADPHLWYRMIHEADRASVSTMSDQVCAGESRPLEHRIIHKNGDVRWIKNTPVPRYDSGGRLIAWDGLVADITARKKTEQELLRVNRTLQALSQCSQALVRTDDETQLLSRVCDIIIDPGGYRMCWVGFAQQDDQKRILPVAWAGCVDGYLTDVFPNWSEGPNNFGPCGIAIRSGQPVVIRSIYAEPDGSFWKDAALSRGYGSLVALPLLSDGPAFGMLAIYAAEPGAFDDQEVKHLRDLADDLAYGISSLRAREWHRKVEAALRESEQKRLQEFQRLQQAKREWEVTFDSISDPIFIHDRECRILRANRAYREMAGKSFIDLIGKPFYNVFPRLDESVANVSLEKQVAEENQSYLVEEISVPSIRRIFRGRVYPVLDDGGSVLYSVQVLEDVTETKQAEETMRQEMEISTNLLNLAETATDSMDIERLMDRIVACCAKILGTDCFLSYSWDSASRSFRPGRHTPLPPGAAPLFRTDASPAAGDIGRVARESRRPCIARRADRNNEDPDCFLLEQAGAATAATQIKNPFPWIKDAEMFLGIPLFGKTDCLGLLMGVYRRPRDLSERDYRIIEGIAREVSLALDEACLYRTAMERSMELAHKIETLKVIHEIDRSILSTLEPQEILEAAVRNIAQIIPCDSAEAMLIDKDDNLLQRIAGRAAGDQTDGGARLHRESTCAAEVLAACRPAYTPDLLHAGPLLPEETRLLADGLRSLFRVPLVTKGRAIGVLSVASRRPANFTPDNFSTLEQLASQIGVAFENTRLLTDLQELLVGTVKSLSYAIDAKSSWTAGHSERVTRYALLLGRELGMAETALRDLELAGLLHDVGKLGIFDEILDKKSVLSAEEFEIMKRHPLHGAELLAPIKQMRGIIPAVRHHHERYDGTGYPDGLKGDQIPDLARILAVADAFDSMTGWRPYRKTFDVVEAVEELRRCSGSQFDPLLADHFISMMQKTKLRTRS